MARARRHHYVPETLQKGFLDPLLGQVWFCSRGSLSDSFAKLENRNPRSCFQRRDFYTIIGETGNPSDEVEKDFFCNVDNGLGTILTELRHIIGRGQAPKFCGRSRRSIDNLVANFQFRCLDTASVIDDEAEGASINQKAAERAKEVEVDLSCYDIPSDKQVGRHARVLAQISRPGKLLEELSRHSLHIAFAEERSAFVLGSKVVHRFEFNQSTEIWVPIFPKVCLVYVPANSALPTYQLVKADLVREINVGIVETCLEVASHSDKLLLRLTGAERMFNA